MSVILSTNMRSTLNTLSTTQSLISKGNERLASGKRINSALDGAFNFFQSQGLKDRAKQLGVVKDGISQGMKTLEAAQSAVNSIKTLMEAQSAELAKALSNPTQNARIVTSFSYDSVSQSIGTAISGTVAGVANRLDSGDVVTITLNNDGATASFALNANSTVAQVVSAINNQVGATDLNSTTETNALGRARVRAYLSEGTRGNLVIEAVGSKAAGAAQPTFSVAQTTLAAGAGSASQSLKEVFSLTGAANTAPAESGSLTVVGGQLSVAGGETQANRSTLANNYKNMLSQIEQLARDAGYNGINLLQTDALRISFNENDTTALRVSNSFTDRGSLSLTGETVAAGLQAISSRGFTDTISGNFQSDAEIKNAKKNIDNAIKKMADLGSTFAQNQTIVQVREDFTANQVKTLDAGGDALVVADINEEGAKLLALQTRQQLSVQALSLAGQSEQAVLRLF